MDTTFYDESSRFRAREDVKMIKRPMTLDLDSVKPSKKHRGGPVVLTSPDYNKCTLGSPDLVKFLTEGSDGMVTTTPSPNQCMYLKNSQDDQQEQYVREFASVPAQNHHSINNGAMYPHQQQQMGPEMGNNVINSTPCSIMPSSVNPMEQSYTPYPSAITTSCSSMAINQGPVTTSGMGNCYAPVSNCYYGIPQPVSIKEEPQTVPCMGGSPPLSPIDMEEQERVKLERKRLRNRIAASKCRRRKLERIAKLEDKVFALKNQNSELTNIVTTLREQVCQLKQQVLDHVRSGCELMMSQF